MTLSLGEWDERFHALVSKNMMENPFHPILINEELVALDPNDWAFNHTWLAKPPLSFWCISLSMKIFGINEFGLRFPSLIFSLLTILLAFNIARKLYYEKIGLITAFFYAVNGILYEINIGLLSGDHVDTLFHLLFHIAIYLMLKLIDKHPIKLGMFIGLVIGLAFLTKWIMALFIFFVCSVYFVYVKPDIKPILRFNFSILLTSFSVVSPWLFWISYNFPIEANLIFNGMIHPVNNVVQEHSGPWYYYLNSIRINVNELIYIPIIFLIYETVKSVTKERILILSWILIPVILLSFASTKREVYILISATPLFISMSLFLEYLNIFKAKGRKLIIFFQLLFYLVAIRYCVERVKPWKSRLTKPTYRLEMEHLLATSKSKADSIILVNEPHYIDARFYYGLLGYRYLNDSTINVIKSNGYNVYKNVDGKYQIID